MVLNRLQTLADRVCPESQCGFSSERSTIDMMFSLRRLHEKCTEQKQSLYIAFTDLTKAVDLVGRDGLFKVLIRSGCPQNLLSVIQSFYTGMKGHSFRRVIINSIRREEWSQAGMRACPHPLWHLLRSHAKACLQKHQLTVSTSTLGQMVNITACPD